MSMTGLFRRVRLYAAEVLLQKPEHAALAMRFDEVGPPAFEPDPAYLANMTPELREAVIASTAAQRGNYGAEGRSRLASIGLAAEDLSPPFSTHKAWHALHYVLARHPTECGAPPGNAILGGTPVTQLGHDTLRIMTTRSVSVTARALAGIDPESQVRSVQLAELDASDIYPGGWSANGESSVTWLVSTLVDLREYYRAAEADGDGMLLAIV